MRRLTTDRFAALTLAGVFGFLSIPGSVLGGVVAGPITNPGNGHSYYWLSPDTWTSAEAFANTLGGHLVTINDEAENNWVFDTFGHYGGDSRHLWIGLYQDATNWHWSNGEAVTYANWAPEQPSHGYSGGEPYTLMVSDQWWGGRRWDDWQNLPYWDDPDHRPVFAVAEVVIPEPSTLIVWSLLGASGVTLGWWRRRKRAG